MKPAHPLLGNLERLCLEQIEESLNAFPPAEHVAAAIAQEELRGKDRSDVYRALAKTVRTAVVLAVLLAGCTGRPAPAPGPPCVRVAFVGEEVHVAWHTLPCSTPGLDSVLTWTLPSQHRYCDGLLTIDRENERVAYVWTKCRTPLKQTAR